jgi:hypothetical protein
LGVLRLLEWHSEVEIDQVAGYWNIDRYFVRVSDRSGAIFAELPCKGKPVVETSQLEVGKVAEGFSKLGHFECHLKYVLNDSHECEEYGCLLHRLQFFIVRFCQSSFEFIHIKVIDNVD